MTSCSSPSPWGRWWEWDSLPAVGGMFSVRGIVSRMVLIKSDYWSSTLHTFTVFFLSFPSTIGSDKRWVKSLYWLCHNKPKRCVKGKKKRPISEKQGGNCRQFLGRTSDSSQESNGTVQLSDHGKVMWLRRDRQHVSFFTMNFSALTDTLRGLWPVWRLKKGKDTRLVASYFISQRHVCGAFRNIYKPLKVTVQLHYKDTCRNKHLTWNVTTGQRSCSFHNRRGFYRKTIPFSPFGPFSQQLLTWQPVTGQ